MLIKIYYAQLRKGQTNEKEQCMVHAGSGTGDLISVPDDPAASRSGSKRVYWGLPVQRVRGLF